MINITAIIIAGNGTEERRDVNLTIHHDQLETMRYNLKKDHEGKNIYFIYKHI